MTLYRPPLKPTQWLNARPWYDIVPTTTQTAANKNYHHDVIWGLFGSKATCFSVWPQFLFSYAAQYIAHVSRFVNAPNSMMGPIFAL